MADHVTQDEANAVRDAAARFLGVEPAAFFVADHHHENLSEGAWSIAFEGWGSDDPWPYMFTASQRPENHENLTELGYTIQDLPPGLFIESLTSWAISIYRQP